MSYQHRITPGYVVRHLPAGSNAGRDVALLDIAQDFLLAHLYRSGLFDGLLVFKGGTAIRKFHAGHAGRFSTDLDFAAADLNVDPESAGALTAETIGDREVGPFRFSVEQRRGRWQVAVDSAYGSPAIMMKVDVGPPPWLRPERCHFVPVTMHDRYDFELPVIPTVSLAETLAEKIARLNRTSTARDAYDLVWAATTGPYMRIPRESLRRLAILKMWVDRNGMGRAWAAAQNAHGFHPEHWLRTRDDWDDEEIGLLATPPPSLAELGRDLQQHHQWLADLGVHEVEWARCDERDRVAVVDAILALPDVDITADDLWRWN